MTTKTTQLASGMADIANIALCDIALEKAMARTSTLPGLVCFYGPTGFGKSVSAAWVANRRRAYYVQAKSVWTRKHTLKSILGEMASSRARHSRKWPTRSPRNWPPAVAR